MFQTTIIVIDCPQRKPEMDENQRVTTKSAVTDATTKIVGKSTYDKKCVTSKSESEK